MEINVGDLLTIEGIKYITLSVLNYDNNDYAFVNKMTDEEEATDEFFIMKILDDGIRIIIEDDLKNILIPKFEYNLKKYINN